MESRKKDHINLAYQAQLFEQQVSDLFDYEPLLASNELKAIAKQKFLGKELSLPLWVSSMTGGTAEAKTININLAKACHEFGMGMGLGSCRPLLESDQRFDDFNIRDIIGPDVPLMANLGVAQLEGLLQKGEVNKINELIQRLDADGLMLHINPLQELMQPEGDIYKNPPIETIKTLLQHFDYPLMIKEVGQGMGPRSLKALLETDIAGIEFAALGGTNFSLIELMRSDEMQMEQMQDFAALGHTAFEMIEILNDFPQDILKSKEFIISGGVKPLMGYYLMSAMKAPAIMGMAFSFLKYARGDYQHLQAHVRLIKKSIQIAQTFLYQK